jgi:putative ABC transport system substrate-binding protein
MNSRRELVAGLGASALAIPLGALAQQATGVRRVGVLLFNSPQSDPVGPLREGLHAVGYIDGKTVAYDFRFADGNAERLADLATDLVRLKPEVIVAYGGDVARHAKEATASIPIVALISNDPVQSGLVASIRRPGANVTGVTLIYDELAGKMLDLVKEAVPHVSRIAVLWNPNHADPEFRETERAATFRGVQLQSLEVRRPEDFERAFETAVAERAEAMIIVSTRLLLQQRARIIKFGAQQGIPLVGSWGDWAKDGFLLTFGPSPAVAMRQVAGYVDKILKGASPADLPFERPTRFELVLNRKAATALNVLFPPSLLARADEVIE